MRRPLAGTRRIDQIAGDIGCSIELDMPTLVDLGYENAGDGFRYPFKKPAGNDLVLARCSGDRTSQRRKAGLRPDRR